jgi:hypothetical protein
MVATWIFQKKIFKYVILKVPKKKDSKVTADWINTKKKKDYLKQSKFKCKPCEKSYIYIYIIQRNIT